LTDDRDTTPSRLTGAVLLGVATFGLVALVVLAAIAGHRGPLGIDRRIMTSVVAHRSRPEIDIARVVTRLGSGTLLIPIAALGLVVGAVRRWPPFRTLVPALSLAITSVVTEIAKRAFGRARPPVEWHLVDAPGRSFPSGHASNAAAFLVAVGLALVWRSRLSRRTKLATVLPIGLVVGLVGASRVVLGVHWPSDVVAGWLLGGAVAGAVGAAMVRHDSRKRSRQVAV
jgi:undecaprenyl-diphosphatase